MKRLFFLTVLILIVGIMPTIAQQNNIFPMPGGNGGGGGNNTLGDDLLLPSEMKADSYFVRYELSYPVEVRDDDRSKVVQQAKEEILKALFSDHCRENNALVCFALRYHAGSLVKVDYDNISKKRGKWYFYADYALVNLTLMNYLARNIDNLMKPNTVVLYPPHIAVDNVEVYEYARSRLQSKLTGFQYKMTSIKNIDVMPVCQTQNIDLTKTTYYRELLNCVKHSQNVDAQIAVIIREIRRINVTDVPNGKRAEVELHIQIFNVNTTSFVLDEFRKGTGEAPTTAKAEKDAIEKIINKYIEEYMIQMTGNYYTYAMDGREFNIFIPDQCYDADLGLIFELEDELKANKLIQVTDNNYSDALQGTVLKCRTWIMNQNDLIRSIYDAKKKTQIKGRIKPKGEGIEIVP